jgi:hypothetical protein
MSSVVEFELRLRGPRKDIAVGASAEIIIFPGVRFERLETVEVETQLPTAPTLGTRMNGTRGRK